MNYQMIIEDLQKLQEFDTKQNTLRKLLDDNKSNMSFTLYATMVDLIKLEQPDLNMLNELMMASLNYLPNELHKKNLELQHKLDTLEKDYNDNLILLDHTEGERDELAKELEDLERRNTELEEKLEEFEDSVRVDSADLECFIDEATDEISNEVGRILHNLFNEITEN